eukprot:scaffold25343_cov166-Cylindrotheca_fusiformis.AAC.1
MKITGKFLVQLGNSIERLGNGSILQIAVENDEVIVREQTNDLDESEAHESKHTICARAQSQKNSALATGDEKTAAMLVKKEPSYESKKTAEIIDESSDEEAIAYDFSQKEEYSFAQWDK